LIDAERGITLGFRSDSAFFVYFFAGCVVVAAAAVLGLALWEWIITTLALSAILAAELFHQSLRLFFQSADAELAPAHSRAQRLASAAVFVILLGACVAIGLILGRRLWETLAA
jgi:diacylglycerol kinase